MVGQALLRRMASTRPAECNLCAKSTEATLLCLRLTRINKVRVRPCSSGSRPHALHKCRNIVVSKYQYADVETNIFGKQSKRLKSLNLLFPSKG